MDPYQHKEEVFREMEREAREEELLQKLESKQNVVEGEEIVVKKGGIPFSWMDMSKQAAFGGCIGTCHLRWPQASRLIPPV